MPFEKKPPVITAWTIANGVCLGIIMANMIQTFWAVVLIKIELDHTLKQWMQPTPIVEQAKQKAPQDRLILEPN